MASGEEGKHWHMIENNSSQSLKVNGKDSARSDARTSDGGRAFSDRIMMFLMVVPILLLGLAGALIYWVTTDVREAARAEFNQQQLMMARQVAGRVGSTMQTLRLELSSVGTSLEEAAVPSTALPSLLTGAMRRASSLGLVEIRYVDKSSGRATVLKTYGKVTEEPYNETDIHLLQQPELSAPLDNQPYVQDAPFAPQDKPLLLLAIHVDPPGADEGILYFAVDARQIAGNAVAGIRAGKTGYAWIMDANGIFLAHPVKDFVGQSAFEARGERQPKVSFSRINDIQKYWMMAGQEGTSWFVSEAWTTQEEGKPIEKLIAFTPIQIGGRGEYGNWSVAVVTPSVEAEAVLNGLWLKLIAALVPAVAAVGLIVFLIVPSQQRQAQRLQKAIQEATLRVEKSEAQYRTLVESADDLIMTLSGDGRILSANRAAQRFFKRGVDLRSSEEIVGTSIREHLSEETAEQLLQDIREVVEQRRVLSREHAFVIGEREYWFNTKLRLLEETGPEAGTVLAISRDMTHKRSMDERMFNTEKLAALGTLAAGVAHELNNPLTSILGFADLLLERFPPDCQEYQDLKIIEERGEHCRQIVENLLDYARAGTSLGEVANVNDDLETVLHLVSNTLLTRKIRLERNLDPDIPSVRGNSKELQQVFLNLINNAIHAMKDKGGTLTVSSAIRGNRIMVKVADTGTGIPADIQSKIFDPFFTTKGHGEGTGLGLSVSLGLVQKLGGTITVSSSTGNPQTGEPSGSVFTVVLPLPPEAGREKRWATATSLSSMTR